MAKMTIDCNPTNACSTLLIAQRPMKIEDGDCCAKVDDLRKKSLVAITPKHNENSPEALTKDEG